MEILTNSNTKSISIQRDAYEAYRVFMLARRFFFWLIFAGLLFVQASFWVLNSGALDSELNWKRSDASYTDVFFSCANLPCINIGNISDHGHSAEKYDTAKWTLFSNKENGLSKLELTRLVLKIWNYVLTFGVIVYCLALLIIIKIALIGRLGGLADASRAFFLSLVVMVLLVPWQRVITAELPDAIPGAIFNYTELVRGYQQWHDKAISPEKFFIYYGRFVGLWALATLIFLATQRRSWQAGKKVKQLLVALPTPLSAASGISPEPPKIE